MAILTFPNVAIAQAHWQLIPRTQGFESELTGDSQDVILPGDRWAVQLTVTDLMGREARLFSAFINSLRGRAGRFYLSPPGCGTPLGTVAGNGVVSGAGQAGSTLSTSGWTANQAELFAIGDYFQIGVELKQITATIASNASGLATLVFTPPLRKAPTNGSTIVTVNPACIMKPVDNAQGAHDITGPRIYAFQQSYIEALDI